MISRILVSFQSPGRISLKLQLEEEVSSSKLASCYSLGNPSHYNSFLTLRMRLIYLPRFGNLFLVCYVWRMTLNFVLPPPEPTCQGLRLEAGHCNVGPWDTGEVSKWSSACWTCTKSKPMTHQHPLPGSSVVLLWPWGESLSFPVT